MCAYCTQDTDRFNLANSGQWGQVGGTPDLRPGTCEVSRGKTQMQHLEGQGILFEMLTVIEKLPASEKVTGKKKHFS